jgi:hypothetical protein
MYRPEHRRCIALHIVDVQFCKELAELLIGSLQQICFCCGA